MVKVFRAAVQCWSDTPILFSPNKLPACERMIPANSRHSGPQHMLLPFPNSDRYGFPLP